MSFKDTIRRIYAAVVNRERPIQYRWGWLPSKEAGMPVTHDSALSNSAVWACVRTISEDLAKLPWRIYSQDGDTKRDRSGSITGRLLNVSPNIEMSAFSFRETMLGHALTWGNGYAEIERNANGQPIALWPLPPDCVSPKRDEDGTLLYEVRSNSGNQFLPASSIYHLHGLGWDGLVGYSVITQARKAIGLGLAAEQFGADFFANGITASVHLYTPNQLSDTARTNLKADLDDLHRGAGKRFRPMVLEEGIRTENVSLPLADAQFIESRKFQVNEIARWYRVPPHKIGDLERATFTNIEQQAIEYVTDCLMPWARRMEQEASRKLLPRGNSYYTKLNLNALMRGDSEARAKFYREMLNLGAMSPDEIRAFEDMDPIPGGDGAKFYMQMNMTTLDKIGQEPDPEPDQEPDQEPGQLQESIEAHTQAMESMFRRIEDRGERAKLAWVRTLVSEQVDLLAAACGARGADYEVLIDTTTNSALDDPPGDLARLTLEWVQQIAAAYRSRNTDE